MDPSTNTPIEEVNQAILDGIARIQPETGGAPQPTPEKEKVSAPDSGKIPKPSSVQSVKAAEVPVEEQIEVADTVVREVPEGDDTELVGESVAATTGSTAGFDETLLKLAEMADIAKMSTPVAPKRSVLLDSEGETESMELSSQAPTKKRKKHVPSRIRTQPARSGKLQKVSSEVKKETNPVGESSMRPAGRSKVVMEEFGVDEKFLKENQLAEVFDWIEFQGWADLFKNDELVDKELVVEFYRKVSKVEKGPVVYLNFNFKGQELTVSSRDLAYELGLKHEGFDIFTKKHWPESISEEMKEEMELRVCNYADPKNTDLTTNHMDPKVKILHRFLVTTIMPRGSKPALVQIQDILVLDQMLRKLKVNLPKLIIHQMEYISQQNHVGYARIVKKILEIQNVYEPKVEESVMKPLTMHSIHRWGIHFDEDLGWIRKKSTVEEVPVQKPEEKGEEVSPTVLNRLDKIEKEVAEVKGLLTEMKVCMDELKTDMGKMVAGHWMIDDEISGLKSIIKAGFAGRT